MPITTMASTEKDFTIDSMFCAVRKCSDATDMTLKIARMISTSPVSRAFRRFAKGMEVMATMINVCSADGARCRKRGV